MATTGEQALEASVLQALYDISVVAAGGRNDPASVARIAAAHAAHLLDVEGVAVFVWNAASGLLEPVYETPSGVREPAARPQEGMVGQVFATGQALAVDDYQAFAGRLADSASRGMRSAMAVPMLVQGRAIGVMGLWTYELRRFEERHIQLVSVFANQIAPAVEAARSFEETRERHDALQALQDVAMAIAGVKDPVEAARTCAHIAAGLLAADSALISWYDPAADLLVPLAAHGVPSGSNWAVPPGTGARGVAFLTRRPVVVDDYPKWPHAMPDAVERGVRAIAALPLVVRDQAVGALSVTSRQPGRRFSPREVELLTLFGSLVAPDLEAAQLLDRSEQQVRDLTALQEIAVAASGLLDPEALARLTVDTARDLLEVDSAVLRWWEPDRGTLRLLATNDQHSSQHVPEIADDQGVIGAAFSSRAAQHVDRYAESAMALPWVASDGVRTALAVPLIAGDRPVGALAVATYADHHYDDRARGLLTSFAALVAPALEAARLTQAQAEHDRDLQTIYSAMACGVVVWDADGRVVEVNDMGLQMFGLTRDDLDGRSPSDIAGYRRFLEDGEPLSDDAILELVSTAEPVRNLVVGYEKPGGEVLWLQLDFVQVMDAENRVRRVIASFIDIGPVKRAEAARRESEAKSRFLAAMSHELRTPLNSILGFTQLLESERYGPLSERQLRYVGHITTSGRHLLDLVNDLLDISKVAAGQMEFRVEAVDTAEVICEVLARSRPLADSRGVTVHQRTPVGAVARADRRRVEQVLTNLVSNALKFTDEGGRVEVEARRRRADVVLTVRDNGIGIPRDQHERIFGEFTQIDDGRSRRAEGTGLGLALSRRLVEQMGGRLWMTSEPGQGSAFYFSLPAQPAGTSVTRSP